MLLRVIISENEIRRLSIEDIPTSVEELYQVLRANFGLRGGFILQFEDPDFNNQLCNLTDIKYLPAERATLKVVFIADDVSDSTLDTCSFPSLSSVDSAEWPDPFPIPQFSHDVELQLKEANCRYAKDGSVMVIPKGLKTGILDTLADSMSKISAYPDRHHYESVAKSLVEKHPSLKDPGSEKGWYSWFHSLKFKLGNYRQKLSAAGCPEVIINKRKAGDVKGKRVKKSKKGEVNYCPDPPEGQTSDDLEEKRKMMEVEMLKKDPDHQLVEDLMAATFSQRRKEIVGDQPLITEVTSRWPALFNERQIRAEFKRIVTTDLLESFLNGLDGLVPRLLEMYKAATRSGKKQSLRDILDCLEKDDTNERRRTAALLGLPHFITGEDPSDVIRMCNAHVGTLDEAMKGMQLGLLIGYEDAERNAFPREVFSVAVVVEETIVLHNMKDVPLSFAMLMGVIYCVNLEYPEAMRYSFEFLQRVVMKIKADQASARVHGIRNRILSSCLSETYDAASSTEEKKEADWVKANRSRLIQEVTLVKPIADKMLELNMIHNETYANIMAPPTRQDQMREIFGTLTTVQAKSYFYRILQDIQPGTENIQEVIKRHKKYLRDKFKEELEGTETDRSNAKSLDQIYTELHIIQGESEYVNNEHEIWEIEDKTKDKEHEGVKIACNDIFKSTPRVSSGQDREEVRAIRTVMTKGIAGIGKTVSVKKFILDWADGRANQDLDFIFVLPFRELNLVNKRQFSLETLVRKFHPELKKISVATIFDQKRVLFIFDGLDESNLKLDFKDTEMLTEATEESSVDTLVTNLIREHLLPSAFVWITSRPGAVQRIPRKYVYQWTEVRGFNDPQKEQYFRKVVEDKAVADKIVDNIKMSRSLYIMCHIPIFCWIAAKVLVHLLQKMDKTHNENIKIPTTLTEMYTHFLYIQMQVAAEKYTKQDESEEEKIFKLNKEFILKLGRMAFEHLKENKIIFTASDLKKYGIDVDKARVHCGLCTEVFKEEDVFNKSVFYCFVHLTVQEYFAALFVYHSFASKKIDSSSLKEFLLIGSEKELEAVLEKDPVDLPVDELIEISIANSTLRKSGELDMFLRFLIGMSLQSTQKQLRGLIQQTEEHSEVVKNIRESLTDMDLIDCSPERCLNLVHCLIELKDSSLHDTVQQYLKPNNGPETQLSPVQCSALADSILMSNTPLNEFDLKKYRPSPKGVFRLVPAVRNSRIVRISGVDLNAWLLETISSALQMPNSVLTELHLTNSNFFREATSNFGKALNSQCKLEVLSLSGRGLTQNRMEDLASAVKSYISNLKELELSGDLLYRVSLCSVFSNGLGRLEKLRLNRNSSTIEEICKVLVTAVSSGPCHLRELELNHTNFKDSDMEFLTTELVNTKCNLEVLRLSHNSLTETGCRTLASVLCSKNSHLTELDLSYNDLHDSGVKAFCQALMNPHCALKTLRLSFCKVTAEGCAALASALRSDHCNLRELDLSFNHLAIQGVRLLTEIQRDPRCSLEKLNVDQNKDYWYDFKLLKKYACDLTLDPNTAAKDIVITEENKKAERVEENQPYPEHQDRFQSHQVLCNESLTGCHYWEVECNSTNVGVAYKSMNRVREWLTDSELGENEKSWCWSSEESFDHDYSFVRLLKCKPKRTNDTIGVYLDWQVGILSFFEVFPDSMTHLYTVCTTFTEPLHPCFKLETKSYSYCKLK